MGCLLCACAPFSALAQTPSATAWKPPARFSKPSLESEEGGLWAIMDREETKLRRSPFAIRDENLRKYLTQITCDLGGEHCPDIRVHLLRTPQFNASMAPNGMMQVWSGLMLRVENEAQIAAVLGHEIGHYYGKHTLIRLQDLKGKAAAAAVLSMFGLVGALGGLAVLGSAMAFSRDQETEADQIGQNLLGKAGYPLNETALIWTGLSDELKAGSQKDLATDKSMFASHPAISERIDMLQKSAVGSSAGNNTKNAGSMQ